MPIYTKYPITLTLHAHACVCGWCNAPNANILSASCRQKKEKYKIPIRRRRVLSPINGKLSSLKLKGSTTG